MNQYTVTLRLNDQEQFMHFINSVGPVAGQLMVTVTADEEVESAPEQPKPKAEPKVEPKARSIRGSKVNETILAALHNSTLTVKQLKEALEAADLSPGSLSTGIAALQKAGQIERVGEGVYALAGAAPMAQAA